PSVSDRDPENVNARHRTTTRHNGERERMRTGEFRGHRTFPMPLGLHVPDGPRHQLILNLWRMQRCVADGLFVQVQRRLHDRIVEPSTRCPSVHPYMATAVRLHSSDSSRQYWCVMPGFDADD